MSSANRFSSPCILDEQNRLRIPSGLRKQLKLQEGSTLTVFANLKHQFVELIPQEGGPISIDPIGRVQLKADLCDAMDWSPADEIFVKLNKQTNGVTLSLYNKHDPTCVFCQSEDTAMRMNALDVCAYHLSKITKTDIDLLIKSALNPSAAVTSGTKFVTLAPAGRVLISANFYSKLGLSMGGKLAARIHPNNYIELTAKADGELIIGGLDLVQLPKEMLKKLGWKESDKLAIDFDADNNLITITLTDKYVPKCEFCDSDDIVLTIQGMDICRYHVDAFRDAVK